MHEQIPRRNNMQEQKMQQLKYFLQFVFTGDADDDDDGVVIYKQSKLTFHIALLFIGKCLKPNIYWI